MMTEQMIFLNELKELLNEYYRCNVKPVKKAIYKDILLICRAFANMDEDRAA
jgi:hypothetical protein